MSMPENQKEASIEENPRKSEPESSENEQEELGKPEGRKETLSREQFTDPQALKEATKNSSSKARDTIEHVIDGRNPFQIGESSSDSSNGPSVRQEKYQETAPKAQPETTAPKEKALASNDKLASAAENAELVDFDNLYSNTAKSDAAKAREDLKKLGIDTSSPKTGIDLYEPFYESAPQHLAKVRETITDPEHGMSPAANVREFQNQESSRNMKLSDFKGPNQLGEFAAAHSTQTVRDLSNFIENNYLKNDRQQVNEQQRRVLNISQEHSQLTTAAFIAGQLRKEPEANRSVIEKVLGTESANNWINQAKTSNKSSVDGNEAQSAIPRADLELSMEKALVPHVKEAVSKSAEFQEAISSYREITRQAAENGTIIVVSAGNEGDRADGSVYNYYAQSDHVIGVGGHDTNQTPDNPNDDKIWERSSPGNERFHPTVTAPSKDVPSRISETKAKSGTSYSAPLVSVTTANMIDQNPNISFRQAKDMLERSSRSIPDVSQLQQGAGRVDPVKAILMARSKAERKSS